MTGAARGLALLAACLLPGFASAQTTPCNVSSDRFTSDSTAAGRVTYLAGNVIIRCPARRITLKADSAEQFQFPARDFMIGNVVYDEPRIHVTSDFLNHLKADERVVAVGNVHVTLPSGSSLVGPIAEYRRASARVRPNDQILAQSRPTITLVEKDSSGKVVPPTTVVAQTVFMDDSVVYASGDVVISRTDVAATADSAVLDQPRETMRLMRQPILKGKKGRSFTLSGELIDLYSRDKKLQRIISRAKAKAVSDSTTLVADTIDLRLRNDVLDHAYAWGKTSRARVESPNQTMTADSIDVTMPGQRIQLVRALTRAMAENAPDTTRFRVEKNEKDWLRGDTIIAHFDTAKAVDTSKGPDVKQLVASGHANSFYHLAPSDTSQKRPAINYVTARIITVDFEKSRLATVTTVDSVSGLYLEPRDSLTAPRRATTAGRGEAGGRGATPARGNTAGRGGNGQTRPAPPSSIVPLPPKKP